MVSKLDPRGPSTKSIQSGFYAQVTRGRLITIKIRIERRIRGQSIASCRASQFAPGFFVTIASYVSYRLAAPIASIAAHP
jgi:hypothetical protein